jgi:hypothetical protein
MTCGDKSLPWLNKNEGFSMQSVIPMEKLKDFIAFARARCHPQITDAAAEDLVNNYLQLRRAGSSRKVTPHPTQHTHPTSALLVVEFFGVSSLPLPLDPNDGACSPKRNAEGSNRNAGSTIHPEFEGWAI